MPNFIRALTTAAAALLFTACAATAQQPAEPTEAPVQVMILGTYHFANPGLDLHNVEADDVTAPRRQAEIADVTARLARFAPTRVAIEARPDTADLSVPAYRAFTPADLQTRRNETVQIGYRLAHLLGHADIYGIDVEGDFPYGALQEWSAANGRASDLEALSNQIGAIVGEFQADLAERSIGQSLAWMNDPERTEQAHRLFYYGVMNFADAENQPGADLNAAWYQRNARTFAKLAAIAEPGDRIVVIYGAGHNYWLRHFVQTTPGFELVEANSYLTD